MLELTRTWRLGCAAALAGILATTAALPSQAATGVVRIHVMKAGFIFGATGGNGVLRFRGRNYPLNIGGVSVGTIGAAGADLSGRVYNLRGPADIAGTYTALSGSAAIGTGTKAIRLQNPNGVVLDLQGPEAGLEASASLSGMGISIP
jgi:hypothetical protein